MFWLLFVCLYVNSETQTVMGGFQKQADYGPDNSWLQFGRLGVGIRVNVVADICI